MGLFERSVAASALRHDYFDVEPGSAWLAGLVAADGSIATNERSWSVAQSGAAGLDMIEHIRSEINHRLTINVQAPSRGAMSYGIYVPSRQMVGALRDVYGIGPRKTLTYEWPEPAAGDCSAFLRGYIDGDGCVGEYQTPKGEPFLHISFVGTPAFAEGASAAIPAMGRMRVLKRCRNLAEVRYSGRHAWDAGAWLYADKSLYSSPKQRRYEAHVASARPSWLIDRERRSTVLGLLEVGKSLRQVASETGVHLSVVCAWKREAKEQAA
jgi:hypothetical protein